MQFHMVFLFCLGLHSIIAMDKRILHGKQVTNFGRFFFLSIWRNMIITAFFLSEKEWGFMVSLHRVYSTPRFIFFRKTHLQNFCSGSIISPQFVITAGHCVIEFSLKYDKNQWMYRNEANMMIGIRIMSNSKYSQSGKSPSKNIHLVVDIMIHPDYVST